MAVKPVPEGYHTLTPYFTVRMRRKQSNFTKGVRRQERGVMKGPERKGHAC